MKSSCGGNSCPLSVFTEGESHAEEAQGAGSHALREMTCSHVDKEKLIFHCLMPCSLQTAFSERLRPNSTLILTCELFIKESMVLFSFVVCFHVSWYFDTLPPVLHLTTILIMLLFVVTGSSAKLPLLIQKKPAR